MREDTTGQARGGADVSLAIAQAVEAAVHQISQEKAPSPQAPSPQAPPPSPSSSDLGEDGGAAQGSGNHYIRHDADSGEDTDKWEEVPLNEPTSTFEQVAAAAAAAVYETKRVGDGALTQATAVAEGAARGASSAAGTSAIASASAKAAASSGQKRERDDDDDESYLFEPPPKLQRTLTITPESRLRAIDPAPVTSLPPQPQSPLAVGAVTSATGSGGSGQRPILLTASLRLSNSPLGHGFGEQGAWSGSDTDGQSVTANKTSSKILV